MEPWGEQIADLRHGTACALLANVNRMPENRPEPYKAEDFIHWTKREAAPEDDDQPVQIDDPIAHSNLIRAALFGMPPKTD